MNMLDKLFSFPIVMIDGDNEDRKARTSDIMALDNEQAADMIMGEAECPYYDFVSVTDRWLPNEESFDRALEGKFDACGVIFSQSGTFIVPWNKKKFKRELNKFIEALPKEEDIIVTDEQLIHLIKKDGNFQERN